jgi:formylmethanofuran dehydrogenase subunit B
LNNAHQPLFVLTGDVEQEAIYDAVNLARSTSAYLVQDSDNCGNISSAMRTAGLLSATLADLRDLADQVVILGDDPETSLPRFWEFAGNKKKEKAVWIKSKQPVENIRCLRLMNRGSKTILNEDIKKVAARIGKADSGVVFVSSESIFADVNALTEIMLWLKELGESKKWYGQILIRSTNENGISQALMSATGYPGALRFSKGNTYHDLRSLQLERIIENHEVDTIVIIGGVHHLPKLILEKLDGIKTVILSSEKPNIRADVWLPCAQVGIDAPGTMLRLDGVPLKFEQLVKSDQATAQESLIRLTQGVRA